MVNPGETHKTEIVQFHETCKPIISKLLGSENYNRFCEAALREYDNFASQIPTLEDNGNKNNFFEYGPFMLSTYRALLGEFSIDQNKALDILRQITNFKVQKTVENMPANLKAVYSGVATSDSIRDLTLKIMTYEDEKYGWATVFPKSDAYMAIDFTKCGLTEWLKEQGVPEITPIACDSDVILFGTMTGLTFQRSKTIAKGDEICDFRFVKN